MIQNTYTRVYWFNIKVYDKRGGNLIAFLSWTQLRWELRTKYDWYFRYRAALLQVQYPKFLIDTAWGNETPDDKAREQLLKNMLRAKKAKITGLRNKLHKAREEWNSFLPVEEDPVYLKCLAKVERLEAEFKSMSISNIK